MFKDSLFISGSFKYAENLSAETAISETQTIQLKEEAIPQRNQSQNWGFILFLICFFIIAYSISKKSKLISYMLNSVFRFKDRQNLFFTPIDNDLYTKILLCIQSTILIPIILLCIFTQRYSPTNESISYLSIFIGSSFLLLNIFLLYKYLSYRLVGYVFFKKEAVDQWLDDFYSILALSGIILFLPTLIMFYIDKAYYFCYYFILLYFIFVLILIIYKNFVLFFQDRRLLLYLFLYLCAQEIMPLFLLYKGVVYLFITVQKDNLWHLI